MNPLSALAAKLEVSPAAPRETLTTGVNAIDAVTGGFPRGAISEIIGPESSGRTALAHALLASSTSRGEICCYIDT
ncbi:MAG TPA: hypothetical protein VFA04_04140, partial [Bryobacteraceae bacterium]|nr:hypothetical protein [Bryobacteraceae bacterium]